MTTFLLFLIVATVYQSTTHVSAADTNPFGGFDAKNDSDSLFASDEDEPHHRHAHARKSSIPSLLSASSSTDDNLDLPELLYENNTILDEALSASDPTSKPTDNPTHEPTQHPTKQPTDNPTRKPTKQPTRKPTKRPTAKPTKHPTHYPTTTKPTEAWDSPPQNGKSKPIKPKPAKDDSMSDDALLRVLDDQYTIKKKQSNHTSIKIYSFQNHSNTPLLIKFQNEMIAQHSGDLIIVNSLKCVDPKWIERMKPVSPANVHIDAYYGNVYQFALTLHSFIDIAIQFGQQSTTHFIKNLNRWFQGVIRQFQSVRELKTVFHSLISAIQREDTLLQTANQCDLFAMIQNAFKGNANRFDLLHISGLDVVDFILSFYAYSSTLTVRLFTNWNTFGLHTVMPYHDTDVYFSEVELWNKIYLTRFTALLNTLRYKTFDQYKNYSTQHQDVKQTFATLFDLLSPYLIAKTVHDRDGNHHRNIHIICTNEVDTSTLKMLLRHIQSAKNGEFKMNHFLVTQNKAKKGQKAVFDLTLLGRDKKKRKQSTAHPTQSPTINPTTHVRKLNHLKNETKGAIKLYLLPPASSPLFLTELITQQKDDVVLVEGVDDDAFWKAHSHRVAVYIDPFLHHLREFFRLIQPYEEDMTPTLKDWFQTLARKCTQYQSHTYSLVQLIERAVRNIEKSKEIKTKPEKDLLRYMNLFAGNVTSFDFDTIPDALWTNSNCVGLIVTIVRNLFRRVFDTTRQWINYWIPRVDVDAKTSDHLHSAMDAYFHSVRRLFGCECAQLFESIESVLQHHDALQLLLKPFSIMTWIYLVKVERQLKNDICVVVSDDQCINQLQSMINTQYTVITYKVSRKTRQQRRSRRSPWSSFSIQEICTNHSSLSAVPTNVSTESTGDGIIKVYTNIALHSLESDES
eukprot:799520_1